MKKSAIGRTAARLRLAVAIGWGALALAYLAGRFGLGVSSLSFETQVQGAGLLPPLLLADLSMLILSVGLFRLTQMLAALAREEYFSPAAVGAFRGFAFYLFLVSVLWVLAPIVSELLGGGAGDGRYQFRLAIRDVLTLVITLILFLVARLLERARQIDEDMQEIV